MVGEADSKGNYIRQAKAAQGRKGLESRSGTKYHRATMKWRLDDGQIEVVDDAMAEVLRRKTMAQRIMMVSDMHRTARLLLEAQIRRNHSDWDDDRIMAQVARRIAGGAS